jgi:hypothetical protein
MYKLSLKQVILTYNDTQWSITFTGRKRGKSLELVTNRLNFVERTLSTSDRTKENFRSKFKLYLFIIYLVSSFHLITIFFPS